MGKLINVDNGGTLTDVVVIDAGRVHRVKTLTTPHDLSKCLFDGLQRAAYALYGENGLAELLRDTDFIRYSTTQGTNALVQRRGPRLGLLVGNAAQREALRGDTHAESLAATLIGDRVTVLPADAVAQDEAIVPAINALTWAGANRIVVSLAGAGYAAGERALKRVALKRFPSHMLGTVPILYSHEVIDSADEAARTWTAVINAFLHPAMESFLYHTEGRLRGYRMRSPLLVFRNDGGSARVAKTSAIRTYSSGPRGGLEGVRAYARHYVLDDVLSLDVGGTTTDIGRVRGGTVAVQEPGRIDGITVALPLADVASTGVGGGSVLRVVDGEVRVGPLSVGAVPGPACFGRGGTEATITDAMLVAGLLAADTYFGGELPLDRARAVAAIERQVCAPLGVSLPTAIERLGDAWVRAVAAAVRDCAPPTARTVLAVFGGAGPLLACAIAAELGLACVIVPGAAAVFSAFGIGFSDLAQEYDAVLPRHDTAALVEVVAALQAQARRDMYAEGIALAECRLEAALRWTVAGRTQDSTLALAALSVPREVPEDAQVSVRLRVAKEVAHPQFASGSVPRRPAVAAGTRAVLRGDRAADLPVFLLGEQLAGATAPGPAVLEDPYFTALLPADWDFELSVNGDLWLRRRT